MAATKLRGYDFYRSICKEARFVVAPMVEASELPWRLLSRRYNSDLAYTPMMHALNFASSKKYRDREFTTCPQDRPLFVQFCSNDPETLLKAAKFVEDQCDAVDINLGCPQNIAKRGHYGAFLQDEWELVESLVRILDQNLKVPVTCKIRVFPEVEKTVAYAKMLEKAGCSLLTVHGRTREQKGANTGLADWAKIKAVKEALSIPVFANGNILNLEDVQRCLKETGVDGIMTAEGNLYNPAIFAGIHPPAYEIAREYLILCQQYPAHMGMIRGHIFKLLHHTTSHHPELREVLNKANSVELLLEAINVVEKTIQAAIQNQAQVAADLESAQVAQAHTTDGYQKIPYWQCQSYVRTLPTPEISQIWANKDRRATEALKRTRDSGNDSTEELVKPDTIGDESPGPTQEANLESHSKKARIANDSRAPFLKCTGCKNEASQFCETKQCKKCCKLAKLGCSFHFKPKVQHTLASDAK